MSSRTNIEVSSEASSENNHKFGGISSSTLKIIAIIIMFIDHLAAIVVIELPGIFAQGNNVEKYRQMVNLYYFMRTIGRIAFPIFIFLMIEGIKYTKNKYKYLLRMFVFALISEIPFAFAFKGKITGISATNVFFTLTIGLAVCILIENLLEQKNRLLLISVLPAVVIAGFVAKFLGTDYGCFGVMAIVAGYIVEKFARYLNIKLGKISNEKISQIVGIVAICAVLSIQSRIEAYCVFSLIPICLYNGKRGRKMKYFFYAFYPIHLMFLTAIKFILGLSH